MRLDERSSAPYGYSWTGRVTQYELSGAQLRDLHKYARARGVPLEIFTNAKVRGGKLARWRKRETLILTPIP